MAQEIKITKAMVLTVVKAMAAAQEQGVDLMDGVTAEDIIAYCDTTMAQLEAKKEKAAEARAKKAEKSDELKAAVLAVVSNEPQTRDEIFAALDTEDEEISVAKVGARLTKLVAEGAIVKDPTRVKGADGKSVVKMTYVLAQ